MCTGSAFFCPSVEKQLTFRIDRVLQGAESVLRLSGQLHAEDLPDLKRELAASGSTAVLDLEEVTLLDVETVRSLELLERQGIELRSCAPYIRAWISRERAEREGGAPPG